MPRPKNTVRTEYFHIGLPEDLAAKLRLSLFSEVEGKIPLGAQQQFFIELVSAHFKELVHEE